MNDTNVGMGMYAGYDSLDEKEIERLRTKLEAERHAHRLAAADAERLADDITNLQRALNFWLPGVFTDDPSCQRAGDDAILLYGYEGEDEPTALDLGWIRLGAEVESAETLAHEVEQLSDALKDVQDARDWEMSKNVTMLEQLSQYRAEAEKVREVNARMCQRNSELKAECEAAAAYVSVIPISAGLTPEASEQYRAYIPYLTARTAK